MDRIKGLFFLPETASLATLREALYWTKRWEIKPDEEGPKGTRGAVVEYYVKEEYFKEMAKELKTGGGVILTRTRLESPLAADGTGFTVFPVEKDDPAWQCPACGDWLTDGEDRCKDCNETPPGNKQADLPLWGADENCRHKIEDSPGGGYRCTKCGGWYCP